jgi:L-lactate dehydrogenase (cytochrome)
MAEQTPNATPGTPRRMPSWPDLKPLIGFAPPTLDRTRARLARAATISDLRTIALRRTPRSVFDYVDGAAEDEVSLARARRAFRDVTFTPRILRDVSRVDTSTTILGKRSALPMVLAPTGFTRMMHYQGERAVAPVAERAGIPYTLSTMGTVTIEDVAAAAPGGRHWFQLYLWKDRAASTDLVRRAADSGYDTLVLTVDTPVAGARQRDVRNGMTIPPQLTLKTFADMAMHPTWWFNLLTTEPLTFASVRSSGGTVAEMINRMFDPTAGVAEVEWLRSVWPGSLVIKGIQSVPDAVTAVEAGADAVVLSNHGGRQLDRAPTPLQLLPRVVDAVGDRAEVMLDTGILSGADVVAAVANGAKACLVGRAYLYGLMAGGQRGVQRAVDILTAEITRTMQLLGTCRVADLGPEHAALPHA